MSKTSAAREQLSIAHPDDLRIVRNRTLYERRFKRPLDVIVGGVAVVAALPVMGVISLCVRAGLGKGVLYSQERAGMNGEPFTIYKFRTMRPDRRRTELDIPRENDRRVEANHKNVTDPRHTGLGRILRKLSLDELPQLLNVMRGEMSLVGPRPEMTDIARQRGYLNHVRHEVKPGMTGPYQTSLLRYNGDLRDGLDLDAEYVNNVTLGNDLRYLVKTFTVFFGERSGS